MKYMTTESEALDHLSDMGYTANLELRGDGQVAVAGQDKPTWHATDVIIEERCRYEGLSNPDDESLILGVALPDGSKGALAMPYGPDVSGPQADAIRSMLINRPTTG